MGVEIVHSVKLVDEDNDTLTVSAGSDPDDAEKRWRIEGPDRTLLIVSSADLAAFGAALRDLVTDEIWATGRTANSDPFLTTEP